MATVKKMARVVILDRLGYSMASLPVFDMVGAFSDADLLREFNIVKAKNQTQIAQQREQLTTQEADLD